MPQPFPSNYSLYPGSINTKRYMPPAMPGMLNGEGTYQCYPYTNTVGTLEQWSLTLPTTPDASATYWLNVNGYAVSAATDSTPTKAELATALLAAIRADAQLFSEIEVDLDSSSNNFTIWARQVGKTLTITSNPTGQLTNALTITKSQSTTTNPVIPFGRFVGRLSSYYKDPFDGYGAASLVNATSGFEILGATVAANYYEKVGRFQNAQEGYPYGTTMDVMRNTGTLKGVWLECVESTIAIGDPAYIAVGAGNEGKISNTSSGNIALGSAATILSNTQFTFGNRFLVLCRLNLA